MDFNLSETHLKWQKIAREFATEVIAPEALERDRIPLAKDRIPWDWIKLADKAGIRTLGVPKTFGGAEESILTMCIVGEELAAADLGFAVIMDQCWKMAHLFKDAMTAEQQQKFIPSFVSNNQATTAIGITEPDIGSDHQGYYDGADIGMKTTAVKDGDSYILNGTKRYISNGCMASLYFITARLDSSKPLSESGAVFIVPSDTPGFRADFFHEKSSQRLATNGCFHLENCRIPASNIMLGEGKLIELRSQYMPGSKAEAAATVLGVGRAAYDYAMNYAKERKQGGKFIVEHQAVSLMLAKMAMLLDGARLQIYKAAWLADNGDKDARVQGLIAKVQASEAAFEVCRLATEILGGAGIMFEHPVEKYLRDAASFLHSDGTNQVCSLRITNALSGMNSAALYGF
ncbi:acyl-CoA/acyl-ACP dehydrogenase [Alphaproteobacteria bacterium]|nr:acyl-CoA/acyl-ACP dehydrogenase [Alphaproteobacteria bacterium]